METLQLKNLPNKSNEAYSLNGSSYVGSGAIVSGGGEIKRVDEFEDSSVRTFSNWQPQDDGVESIHPKFYELKSSPEKTNSFSNQRGFIKYIPR